MGLELEVIPQVADCRIFTILGSQLLDNIIISQEDKPVFLHILWIVGGESCMEPLHYEFYIGASPEKVWDVLTSPEGTRATFFGSELRSSFEVGEPYAYVGPGNDGEETVHVYGKVLAYEPQKTLSLSEHPGPSYYANHEELESRITFTLEPVGNCTKLTLVNDQYTPDHPSRAKAADSWWMVMSILKTYAETGQTLDLGW
jgi:uncharacterized protein YndB with AHSA1/START domain